MDAFCTQLSNDNRCYYDYAGYNTTNNAHIKYTGMNRFKKCCFWYGSDDSPAIVHNLDDRMISSFPYNKSMLKILRRQCPGYRIHYLLFISIYNLFDIIPISFFLQDLFFNFWF